MGGSVVCPVASIEEKVLAAKEGGYKHIILPTDNKAQWENIEQYVKENLEINFVSKYEEIYDIVFSKNK